MIAETTYRWLLIAGFGTLTCVGMFYRIRSNSGEKQKLIERFGDAYRDYVQTTGKYFPRFTAARK